jgi:Domain of unknown function.
LNTLAITCIRDEGPWLLDWIAHHRAAGFSHFLIASHDLADGSDALLDALSDADIITHMPFQPEGEKSVQWQAMKFLSKHPLYKSADLALFFDVDEYLALDEGLTLDALLPQGFDAVPLRWHLFGNSGIGSWDDRPVTERFTMAAPDEIALPLAHFFKTLHRPVAFKALGIHRPKPLKDRPARWIGANGKPMPDAFAEQSTRINLFGLPQEGARAWLNHYSVRSVEEFVLKSVRGLPNHMLKPIGHGYWAERNFNTLEDRRIRWMRSGADAARAELAAFEPLHATTVAQHRARLKALTAQRPVIEMMWHLTLMAGSTPPGATQLAAHLARLKALAQDN